MLSGFRRPQRRWFFKGVEAALKDLKKRGAHPDVFKGRFPEASKVNEVGLPVLEQFLDDVKVNGAGRKGADDVEVRLCLKGDGGEPVEVRVVLNVGRSKRELRDALRPLFERSGDGDDGELNSQTNPFTMSETEVTFEGHINTYLKSAKRRQFHNKKIALESQHLLNDLSNLYSIKATNIDLPPTKWLQTLKFTLNYCKKHVFARGVEIQYRAKGICTITIDPSKGIGDLGKVLLTEDNENSWEYILNRLDWAKLQACYKHREVETALFYRGIDAACKDLATGLGVKAVSCSKVGPILDGLVTKDRVAELRKSVQCPATGHDFVAALAAVGRVKEKLQGLVDDMAIVKDLVTLVLSSEMELGDGAWAVLEEKDFRVYHSGEVVVLVDPSRHCGLVPRVAKALSYGTLPAAIAASTHHATTRLTTHLAKTQNIQVAPHPSWPRTDPTTFLQNYHQAVGTLHANVGTLTAHGLHNTNFLISDEYDYDEDTGAIVLPWDFKISTVTKLPSATVRIERSGWKKSSMTA